MSTKCTPECIEQQRTWRIALHEYVTKWPQHCKSCDGWGYHWYEYDPSPAGIALSHGTMTDCDPCADCIEQGKCPRCGKEVWTEDDFNPDDPVVCLECGWKEDDPDVAPEQPECYCWELDLLKAEREIFAYG